MKRLLLFLAFIIGFGGSAYCYDNTYAVIIGVSDYQDDDMDLQVADKDARMFYNFLTSEKGGSVPSDNIALLLNSRASKQNIIDNSIRIFSKAKKNDRIIFYFSGHGGSGFFCPYDVTMYGENLLYYYELKALFRKAKCKTKLIFADACKSGGLKGDRSTASGNNNNKDDKMNIAVMLSCQYDELSQEIYGGGIDQGLFTYYLIRGLSGEANRDNSKYITIQELYYYVYEKVSDQADMMSEKTGQNYPQHPLLFGNFDLRLIVGKVVK